MNVLFITADQLRGDCLSAMDHPIVRTPSLDRLAAEGVLFARHYAQAAPCGPSRASLYTGMYLMNHRSGTNGTPLDARHTNFALETRRAGCDPVLFGYTDTSQDPRAYPPGDPILRSYEGPLPGIRPVVPMGEVPHAWAEWLAGKGYAIPDDRIELYTRKRHEREWEDGAPHPAPLAIPAEHHDTAFMVEQVMDYVGAQRGRPWLAHLSLLRPHPPWVAPEPYNALYDPARLPACVRAATRADEAAQHPWLAFQLARPLGRAPGDERRLRRLQASYLGLVREVDDQLGRLFDFLRQTGAWDRTLVIFTSDHGEQLGDHWLLGKCGYFEQSYHVPLVVRDPRREADATRGRVVRAFTESVDLMPTLLEWLGLGVPLSCDGASLLPFLRGEGPPRWRSEAHWEYDFRDEGGEPERALGLTPHECALNVVRGERYKYVQFAGLPPLFFDLAKDAGERVNLAADPAAAPLVLEWAQKLLCWRMRHAEQALTHVFLTPCGPVERRAPRA